LGGGFEGARCCCRAIGEAWWCTIRSAPSSRTKTFVAASVPPGTASTQSTNPPASLG
jgi:hypothetical protein